MRSHRTRGAVAALVSLAAIAALGLTASPARTAAQTVLGTVVDRETALPLPAVFLVLEGTDGTQAARGLTGGDGNFILRVPAPGTYRLRAQIIGYADAVTAAFHVADGETVRQNVAVSVQAVSLDGIRAEVGARCRVRPGSGAETARLWEEARKALEVAAWTEEEAALRFSIVEHRRELDARSLRVTGVREQRRQGFYHESPYRSIPTDSLDRYGYVQPVPTDPAMARQAGQDPLWDHFAPDAAVLLSEAFLDGHCFRVAAPTDPDRAHLVGLAFEPVPGRDVPDIRGTLWIDRGTAELRSLDFSYVRLPYSRTDWEQAGGHVEFERLATGLWIVRQWHIRMPLAAAASPGYGGSREHVELQSLEEVGARILGVRTLDGQVLAEASGATLYGVVEDSVTGEPLADATVALVPTGLHATTGPDGVYRLGGLPAGTFEVRVSHRDLELLGGAPMVEEVTLEAGRATRLAVAPSLNRLALERCGEAGAFRDPVVVYGHVREPTGETPVPGALVRLFTRTGEERGVADDEGGFALCIERADTVALAAVGPAGAFRDPSELELRRLPIDRGVLTRQDLALGVAALASMARGTAHRGRVWSNAIIGTVVRHDTGEPVSGAMVTARDTEDRPIHSSVTNEDGRFRVPHPDAYSTEFELTVQHVAYGTITQTVTFRPREQLDVEVVLTERAIEVDPIVVTARRQGFLVEMGYYERLERGSGLFVEREEIERRRPSRLTDIMQGRPGVRVVETQPGQYDIRSNTTVTFRGDCQPAIWVDGAKVRAGGQPRVQRLSSRGPPLYTQPQLSEVVQPGQVQAIEFYDGPAGMPIQYGGSDTSCGLVLVWTRRGGR